MCVAARLRPTRGETTNWHVLGQKAYLRAGGGERIDRHSTCSVWLSARCPSWTPHPEARQTAQGENDMGKHTIERDKAMRQQRQAVSLTMGSKTPSGTVALLVAVGCSQRGGRQPYVLTKEEASVSPLNDRVRPFGTACEGCRPYDLMKRL